ncbi:MAG: peptidase M28 [Thalassobius sp.]|nr:peptidase M28 [Thalassovita sp.]
MSNNHLLILLSLLFITACGNIKNEESTTSVSLPEKINSEFTGDLAYNTTAYVEKYWRIVGNAGFDSSIYKVVHALEEKGFVEESKATPQDQLTYRIEKRPLKKPTWEPVSASLQIVGEDKPLLETATNRNMIAINSQSTPAEGVTAEVVYIEKPEELSKLNVKGKIVFAETNPYRIYKAAIVDGGAIGILTYDNPSYLQPEKNTTSIQFRSIPYSEELKTWAIPLSYAAKEILKKKLEAGKVSVLVKVDTKVYESEELTVVADVKGTENPKQRLVFSAHVQEPGANDNATGVGVALEMASVTAKLVKEGYFSPKRTITFLWGDEIVSTRRYVEEDSIRAQDIKWGISLDMVGENTAVTGGSFLIEKMPDPSAIWTRGKDEHTEWGASEMTLNDMKPHYLNDFVINRFTEQGKRANWQVKSNPFEGGSDHVPFLRAGIPGVLFWHFTDQFYHTDNDRIDKVSKSTLKNVGTAALISAFTLVNADENTAQTIIDETTTAGVNRLDEELTQAQIAIKDTATVESQETIINAWEDWYVKALATCTDLVEDSSLIQPQIDNAKSIIEKKAADNLKKLKEQS